MTNAYYNPTGAPAQGTAVTSAVVRTEFAAIQAGFDKMPALTGNAYKVLRVKGDESGFEASGLTIDVSGWLTAPAGLTVSGAAFTSRGITDNATGKALTLSGAGGATLDLNTASGVVLNASAAMYLKMGGYTALQLGATFGANTYISITSPASGSQYAQIEATGGSDVALRLSTRLAGAIEFRTAGGTLKQAEVIHTTSADRYPTLTGGNSATSGIATISTGGVVGGSLFISSATGNVAIGGTAYATSGLVVGSTGQANHVVITDSATNPQISTNAGDLSLTSAANMNLLNSIINLGVSGSTVSLLATSGASTMNIRNTNAASNLNLDFSTTGTLNLRSHDGGTARTMVAISHTAGADRWITMTGSNGGNPTIGVGGGGASTLALGAAVEGASSITAATNLFASGYAQIKLGTATPAGGAAQTGLFMGSAAIGIYWGSGAPTVSAAQGSLYIRTDGAASSRLYSNNNGSTGWSAITSA